MIKTLLVSMLVLGLASITLTENYASNRLAAGHNQPAESPYAGRWNGDYTTAITGYGVSSDGESEYNGIWDISIESDGEVIGTALSKKSGHKSSLKGFIDEDGYINLFLKDSNFNNTIKGTLEKRGVRLTGRLKQYCSSGNLCGVVEVILKRSSTSSNPSKSPELKVETPVSSANDIGSIGAVTRLYSPDCLPSKGKLLIVMKDGSFKEIDLSQVEKIHVLKDKED